LVNYMEILVLYYRQIWIFIEGVRELHVVINRTADFNRKSAAAAQLHL